MKVYINIIFQFYINENKVITAWDRLFADNIIYEIIFNFYKISIM